MAYANAQAASGFSLTHWVRNQIEALRHQRARRAAYRQVFSELQALSDRELADVDIARADIHRIAAEYAARV